MIEDDDDKLPIELTLWEMLAYYGNWLLQMVKVSAISLTVLGVIFAIVLFRPFAIIIAVVAGASYYLILGSKPFRRLPVDVMRLQSNNLKGLKGFTVTPLILLALAVALVYYVLRLASAFFP